MLDVKKFNHQILADDAADALVDAGIALTKKYASLANNKDFAAKEEYEKENLDYMTTLMKHCVTKAGYRFESLNTIKNPQIYRDDIFFKNFRAVIAQVITPIAPAVVSERYGMVAETRQIGFGETGRYIIKSNDLFLVSEIAEGTLSGSLQRMYNNEFTANPQPKYIRYDMPWYQVAAGVFDFGEFAYKLGLSFSNYIGINTIQAFSAVVNAWSTASSPYVASGFTDPNYIGIAQKVQAANGGADVIVLGSLLTVGHVFPTTVGLQYGLGEEIAKNGFLDRYKGYRISYFDPAMVGTTVNTTANIVVPDGVLYFIPVGMDKPIKVTFEGESVTVDAIPTETADKVTGMQITMRIAVDAIVGSRFGAITNIS